MFLFLSKDKGMNVKPTVSQLIALLDKPALLKWANKIGLQGVNIDDYKSKSTSAGSDIHKQIENDLKHGIHYDNDKFQSFKSRYEVLQVEPVVECDIYKGRADVLMKRNGITWLFDFKPTASRIYFEQKLQLAAYKSILKPDRVGIVGTDSFIENIVEISGDQQLHYDLILTSLSNIYNSKNILE